MELDGGYECDCFSDGHELADDGVTCEGIWLLLPLQFSYYKAIELYVCVWLCVTVMCLCVCTHTWRKSE